MKLWAVYQIMKDGTYFAKPFPVSSTAPEIERFLPEGVNWYGVQSETG